MKIASATLQMASSHTATQHREISESLNAWSGQRPESTPASSSAKVPEASTVVALSGQEPPTSQSASSLNEQVDSAVKQDPKLQMIKAAIEFLTGRTIKLVDLSELGQNPTTSTDLPAAAPDSSSDNAPSRSAGFGVAYDYHESYDETEQTTFSAQGTVHTADGKTIAFNLDLSMNRSYHEESNVSVRLGDAVRPKDPLVINFNGSAAQLTDQTFSFDLDSDGTQDNLPVLAGGSGYLAFDRNQDGKINNGSELFGPNSGDGFADLTALDEDKNGWIDENDSNFGKLSIWTANANGSGNLQSLKEAGVGALSLSRVSTPFELKNSYNQTLGAIRSSSVALGESGKIATVQQIDVVV